MTTPLEESRVSGSPRLESLAITEPPRFESEANRASPYSVKPPATESSGELLPRFEASQPAERSEG